MTLEYIAIGVGVIVAYVASVGIAYRAMMSRWTAEVWWASGPAARLDDCYFGACIWPFVAVVWAARASLYLPLRAVFRIAAGPVEPARSRPHGVLVPCAGCEGRGIPGCAGCRGYGFRILPPA